MSSGARGYRPSVPPSEPPLVIFHCKKERKVEAVLKEPQIIAWTVEVRTTSPVEGKPFASSRITRAAACLSRDTFFLSQISRDGWIRMDQLCGWIWSSSFRTEKENSKRKPGNLTCGDLVMWTINMSSLCHALLWSPLFPPQPNQSLSRIDRQVRECPGPILMVWHVTGQSAIIWIQTSVHNCRLAGRKDCRNARPHFWPYYQ